jgi:hypothetical protein
MGGGNFVILRALFMNAEEGSGRAACCGAKDWRDISSIGRDVRAWNGLYGTFSVGGAAGGRAKFLVERDGFAAATMYSFGSW